MRERVRQIARLIPRDRPVAYLDYPIYGNVGDHLIEAGAGRFLHELGYEIALRRSAHDFGSIARRRITPETTILFQGGGNFGDLYPLHQKFRESVIAAFPRNRIVMMPQTLHYESIDRMRDTARIFASHPDLHVCLRDTRSMEQFSEYFRNPSYLVPDMAHFLSGHIAAPRQGESDRRTLHFLRKDYEKSAGRKMNGHRPMDWADTVPREDLVRLGIVRRMHDANSSGLLGLNCLWGPVSRRLIKRGLDLVSNYDAIVTDRMHMGIMGLLVGRDVEFMDNSYGKLSSYYSTWLRDIPEVRFSS